MRLDRIGKVHAVYWLGNTEPSVFRTNPYQTADGNKALLVDPANSAYFSGVWHQVVQVIDPTHVSMLSHLLSCLPAERCAAPVA